MELDCIIPFLSRNNKETLAGVTFLPCRTQLVLDLLHVLCAQVPPLQNHHLRELVLPVTAAVIIQDWHGLQLRGR